MLTVTLTADLTGYTGYDPDNPTREAEALCFLLRKNLSNMEAEGFSLIQKESAELAELELYAQSLYDLMLAQQPGNPPPSFPAYTTLASMQDEAILKAIAMLRAALLARIDAKQASGEEGSTELVEAVNGIKEEIQIANQQEHVIYLSDGTPIYTKSGSVA